MFRPNAIIVEDKVRQDVHVGLFLLSSGLNFKKRRTNKGVKKRENKELQQLLPFVFL